MPKEGHVALLQLSPNMRCEKISPRNNYGCCLIHTLLSLGTFHLL